MRSLEEKWNEAVGARFLPPFGRVRIAVAEWTALSLVHDGRSCDEARFHLPGPPEKGGASRHRKSKL